MDKLLPSQVVHPTGYFQAHHSQLKIPPVHCIFNSLVVVRTPGVKVPVCPFATYLFSNTGPGTASFKDNDGHTTTVLNVGRKENNKSTVALSGRGNSAKLILQLTIDILNFPGKLSKARVISQSIM